MLNPVAIFTYEQKNGLRLEVFQKLIALLIMEQMRRLYASMAQGLIIYLREVYVYKLSHAAMFSSREKQGSRRGKTYQKYAIGSGEEIKQTYLLIVGKVIWHIKSTHN